MRLTAEQKARLGARFVEVAREIGVLLLAFAPLEFTLQGVPVKSFALWVFVGVGVAALFGSVYFETVR